MFAFGSMTAGIGLLFAALPHGCTKRLPHGGDDPLYRLEGAHEILPCEACHGEGKPKSLSTVCLDCHEDDRPNPNHNPGRNCTPCHNTYAWDQIETSLTYETGTPEDTGTPPTETGTEPAFDHSILPPTQLCWDCHEQDRSAPDHYTDVNPLKSWDCGPCHNVLDWAADTYEHPARTPHGTYANGAAIDTTSYWVVACDTCHPGGVLTQFDCQGSCHSDLFQPTHFGFEAGAAANAACLGCHINGDL